MSFQSTVLPSAVLADPPAMYVPLFAVTLAATIVPGSCAFKVGNVNSPCTAPGAAFTKGVSTKLKVGGRFVVLDDFQLPTMPQSNLANLTAEPAADQKLTAK
jgi:hypothetical protein